MPSHDDHPTSTHRRVSIRPPQALWFGALAFALIAVPLAWRFGLAIDRQRAAIREVNADGCVYGDYPGPVWLRSLLDRWEFVGLANVETVVFTSTEPPEAVFESIGDLESIDELIMSIGTSDRAVRHLCRLRKLHTLIVPYSEITNEGLSHLPALKSLEHLKLGAVDVTDDGLQHLARLTNLKYAELWLPNVSEAGVRQLKAAFPAAELHVNDMAFHAGGFLSPMSRRLK